jgi:hypothetical protein
MEPRVPVVPQNIVKKYSGDTHEDGHGNYFPDVEKGQYDEYHSHTPSEVNPCTLDILLESHVYVYQFVMFEVMSSSLRHVRTDTWKLFQKFRVAVHDVAM